MSATPTARTAASPPEKAQDDLLVELFTEELPPRALAQLAEAFAQGIAGQLAAHGLADDGNGRQVFCTPRRLAVLVARVAAQAPARAQRVKGPSVAVGLDAAGNPTVALRKWAERQGAAIEALVRASDGKQECFFHESVAEGDRLADVIEAVVEQAVSRLPVPRLMSYQLEDGFTTVSFARPAHRLTVLHGERVLPCRVLGLPADRITEGHRFQGTRQIRLARASDYERELLEAGKVVASFPERRRRIAEALQTQADALGALLAPDAEEQAQVDALLDEVTALVEHPAVYAGRFEDAFLAVPQECLILTMRTNQKYFPLFGRDGRLLPRFLIVSNMVVKDPSSIVDGNERVVRPRLADARFFFDQDRRVPLADRVPRLAEVVYHARLGSQAERSERIAVLAGGIAEALGQDPVPARRAAQLAKADLLTGMVGEFPELQGIMGRYYARHDGEPPAVCEAIGEHYQPRFAGDALPATPAGVALALADKLETLAGIWGVGPRPTGERDPFALRRHALGVVRMLVERSLPLALGELLQRAFAGFGSIAGFEADLAGLHGFVCDRLRGYLRERGAGAADIEAVLATDAERLDRVEARLAALAQFRRLAEFEALAAANKRITNILRKSDAASRGDARPTRASSTTAAGGRPAADVDPARLAEPAETTLYQALRSAQPVVDDHLQRLDFTRALSTLAALREPVDAFFDQVMVNVPDTALRDNRLALLDRLRLLMNRVADLSKL